MFKRFSVFSTPIASPLPDWLVVGKLGWAHGDLKVGRCRLGTAKCRSASVEVIVLKFSFAEIVVRALRLKSNAVVWEAGSEGT